MVDYGSYKVTFYIEEKEKEKENKRRVDNITIK